MKTWNATPLDPFFVCNFAIEVFATQIRFFLKNHFEKNWTFTGLIWTMFAELRHFNNWKSTTFYKIRDRAQLTSQSFGAFLILAIPYVTNWCSQTMCCHLWTAPKGTIQIKRDSLAGSTMCHTYFFTFWKTFFNVFERRKVLPDTKISFRKILSF